MEMAKREIAQLQAQKRSLPKSRNRRVRNRRKYYCKVKEKDQEIASIRLTFGLEHCTTGGCTAKRKAEIKGGNCVEREAGKSETNGYS